MGSGGERMGPAMECMGLSMELLMPTGTGASLEGIGPVMDRMATGLERMGRQRLGANGLAHMDLERLGAKSLEHMGPAMGPALGAGIGRWH